MSDIIDNVLFGAVIILVLTFYSGIMAMLQYPKDPTIKRTILYMITPFIFFALLYGVGWVARWPI